MRSFLRRVLGPTALLATGIAIGSALARMPVRDPIALGSMRQRMPLRAGSGSVLLTQLLFGSLSWYACALSIPLFVWIAGRFPFGRRDWIRSAVVHTAAVLLMVCITASAYFLLNSSVGAAPLPLATFVRSQLVADMIPFLAVIAATHAWQYRRRERERAAEAGRLTAQLTRSRLDALTAQLEPHFLFNTLQGISTLMHRDVEAADATLSQLSDLLRRALSRADGRHEIPLREELDMLDDYAEIRQRRYGNRLDFRRDIAPGIDDAVVPFFIFQPLVENAIKHGIARRSGAGRITVSAAPDGAFLRISVADDGPGTASDATDGIGLANTRERLQALYGTEQSLALYTAAGGGTVVTITLPLRREPT